MDLFTLTGKIAIDSTVANQTINGTISATEELTRMLQGTSTQATKTGKAIGKNSSFGTAAIWFGNMATRVATWLWDIGKSAASSGIEFNSSMEQYVASFRTLMGVDTKTAEAFIEKLRVFAKDTPLTMEGVAENAISLLNVGFQPDEIIGVLSMLGDIAMGDQDKMNRIVRAFSQVDSFGKLRAQEAYQLLDAEVPIYDMLSGYLGVTQDVLAQMQANGEITIKDIIGAMTVWTSEGGRYHNAMDTYMTTYAGQREKMGDTASQTLGALFEPLFEIAKSDILPRMISSLEQFSSWVTENKDSIAEISESIGNIAINAFDGMLSVLQWMIDNSGTVKAAFDIITVALLAGLTAAHPYATAIAALITAYGTLVNWSNQYSENLQTQSFKEWADWGYSDEYIAELQKYVDAQRELAAIKEKAAADPMGNYDGDIAAAQARVDALTKQLDPYQSPFQYSILDMYDAWRKELQKEGGTEEFPNVLPKLAPEAEGNMQNDLAQMDLSAVVQVTADMSSFDAAITTLNRYLAIDTSGDTSVDGSHASGLDFVPKDGYIAKLHYGESVLTAKDAHVWRNLGNSDAGRMDRLESAIHQMAGTLQSTLREIVTNTSTGTSIILDTGVLAGQLAPRMDAQLGTLGSRKGRRN